MLAAKPAAGEKIQGHTLPRTRISAEKFSGTIKSWRGKYGWIEPAEPISHEKAEAHKGSLFVSMDDSMSGARLEMGTPVAYHIYEDESGLGAEEVEATGVAPPGAGKGMKGKG